MRSHAATPCKCAQRISRRAQAPSASHAAREHRQREQASQRTMVADGGKKEETEGKN
jgi:hypothetical protein